GLSAQDLLAQLTESIGALLGLVGAAFSLVGAPAFVDEVNEGAAAWIADDHLRVFRQVEADAQTRADETVLGALAAQHLAALAAAVDFQAFGIGVVLVELLDTVVLVEQELGDRVLLVVLR